MRGAIRLAGERCAPLNGEFALGVREFKFESKDGNARKAGVANAMRT